MGLVVDRMHICICICSSEYFVQSENKPPHIFIDHMSLDFWCASDELKINLSENGFFSKSGIFCMRHRGGYVQKDIVVFKKKKNQKIRFPFSDFHCSYPVLNIANFESRVSNLGGYRAFSITFSNFSTFSTFTLSTRRSGHMTSRMGGGGGCSNMMFSTC